MQTFVDTADIEPWERRPGWRGRIFHSPSMTFAYWDFALGSDIHRHCHDQEEVWHIVEGELDFTVGDVTERCGPGTSAIVPANTEHSVLAITSGRAIVVDYPIRTD